MNAAQQLTQNLGGHWHGSYGTAKCPVHDDREPSLSIRPGETDIVVKCFAGCRSSTVVEVLKQRRLWPDSSIPRTATAVSPDKNREAALRMWGEAKIGSLPYLAERGISISTPQTLRRHGALLHKATGLYLCGMVAAVQAPTREIMGIHRTFLTGDWKRKAPVSSPKMALGALGAGAVRLAAAGEEIGLCESIETGLSAMQLFSIPTWCALGSERLHKVEFPPEVRHVVIFGDNGNAGRKAAMRAVEAFTVRGCKVTLRFPPAEFGDFNDLLQHRKVAA